MCDTGNASFASCNAISAAARAAVPVSATGAVVPVSIVDDVSAPEICDAAASGGAAVVLAGATDSAAGAAVLEGSRRRRSLPGSVDDPPPDAEEAAGVASPLYEAPRAGVSIVGADE
jgi:hypothetical protein